MPIKKQLTVSAENRPGQLAAICSALGKAKVNILAISVVDTAESCLVRMVPSNPARARKALPKGIPLISVRDVVAVTIPSGPGRLAKLAGKLARAKINIEYVYGSEPAEGGTAVCVFAVPDVRKANAVLK